MPQKKVTLTTVTGVVVANPNPVLLGKDDWITFSAGDPCLYTVIIDDASEFNTARRILIYDVYVDQSVDTPTTMPNNTGGDIEVEYNAYSTSSDDANTINPAAPPRIIIKPHA